MDPSNTPRTGLYGWVERQPKVAFWVVLLVALFLGAGVGAAGGTDTSDIDAAKSDARDARSELASAKTERDGLRRDLEGERERADRAEAATKKLSAKAEVPDLTGDDEGAARGNDLVDQLGCKVRTVRETTTSAPAGTVIRQAPKEGSVLKSGRSITLTVARKPPPKPKQWVTTSTLQGASSTKTEEFRVPGGVKARLLYSMP